METKRHYTAIRSITILAVVLIPAPVGKPTFNPNCHSTGSTTHPLCYTTSRAGGLAARLRLADSKPGHPGLSEISAGTGLHPG